MLKEFHSEQEEKGSLHDIATGVSVETVVQTNHGPFPLERGARLALILSFSTSLHIVANIARCCKA